jgi:tetratricopeptide (TPR) repeat protein
MKRIEEAIGEARQAAEDDPLSAWAVGMCSLVLGLAGRHDEGVAEAQRAAALDPHSFIGLWGVVRSHAWAGQYAPAIATAPTALAISGRHPFVMAPLAMAHAGLGNTEIAEAIREEMLARARMEYVPKFWLATIVAAAGHLDEAMQLAEQAIDERDPMVLLAAHMPEWAPLRGHPGFGALLQKLGTPGKP